MQGWISLDRGIMKHWIADNSDFFKWFVFMIMEVNHCDRKMTLGYKLITVKRGYSSNSLRTWATIFNSNTKAVSKFFDLLEGDGIIKRCVIGKGKQSTTLIKMVNYDQYQSIKETQDTTLKTTQDTTQETTQGKRDRDTNNNSNKSNPLNNDNNSNKEKGFENPEDSLNNPFYKNALKEIPKRKKEKSSAQKEKDNLMNQAIDQIIQTLSNRTGRGFQVSTQSYRDLIRARLKDGLLVPDLKDMIIYKCTEWFGTDMEKYLRPETLFQKSKCQGYVDTMNQYKANPNNGAFKEIKGKAIDQNTEQILAEIEKQLEG